MMDIPNKTRWKKLALDELIGADYALRIFRTSPVLRGEALKECESLINEVRMEINSRPDECMRKEQPGFSIRIICCEDCPFKEYGLRKCGEVDRWFDDFEIETGIPEWCPKVAVRRRAYQEKKLSPFDKWQRAQCGTCQVCQSVYGCDQRKYNYRDYKARTLKLTQDCPMRELP